MGGLPGNLYQGRVWSKFARWRSIKHVTTFAEDDGDVQIIHHRERWTNELRLVYADGRTRKLTETPMKSEGGPMEKAHLRLGLLEYVLFTERASTRIPPAG